MCTARGADITGRRAGTRCTPVRIGWNMLVEVGKMLPAPGGPPMPRPIAQLPHYLHSPCAENFLCLRGVLQGD